MVRMFTVFAATLAVMSIAAPAAAVEGPDLLGPGEVPIAPGLAPGAEGPWVEELQERLSRAGYHPGPVDGRFGLRVLGAVYAFQKVHDLPRDGVFRPSHWALLEETELELEPVAWPADRVEVDLGRQVLYLVQDDRVTDVLAISSGNGRPYRNFAGRLVQATTPEGEFTFNRYVRGWRRSYLGVLYEPFYFRGGYAIHGSPSVPPHPASHGCIRVGMGDMDWLKARLHLGMPVYVYGLRSERPTPEPVTEPPPPAEPGEWGLV